MAFVKRKHTPSSSRKDITKGLWTKCPVSGEMVFTKDLQENWNVVPASGYHFPISAARRIELLIDAGTWKEHDSTLASKDPLKFPKYAEKLAENVKKTGVKDTVVAGMGKMNGMTVSLAVMDFRFLGASMGSVAGEKITRAIERSLKLKCPCVVVCASGGARMYEGILSLMQMAKTSAALAKLKAARIPFIPVLTNPTMAGVMASYATLGDVIVAEPGALIGFAGARVIKETTNQALPEGFQTSEFLLKRGLLDAVIARKDLKAWLTSVLRVLGNKLDSVSGTKSAAPAKSGSSSNVSGDVQSAAKKAPAKKAPVAKVPVKKAAVVAKAKKPAAKRK
jgi:acetyl-CoA carboxylase carboxyl transferase subunit beta